MVDAMEPGTIDDSGHTEREDHLDALSKGSIILENEADAAAWTEVAAKQGHEK